MAANKIVVFFMLTVLSSALCQVAQGGPHTDQGGAHTDQGGPNTDQGGPHTDQGGPHQDQSASQRNAVVIPSGVLGIQNPANWTSCDITAGQKLTCHDCNTRLICKPVGGLLKPCRNPMRPHCNNGICTSVPSLECAAVV